MGLIGRERVKELLGDPRNASHSDATYREILETLDKLWTLKDAVDMVIKHRSSEAWADLKTALSALSEGEGMK